ncbi:MAG: efflux RND transporter periplasmic adaptor subunit [Victivallales bacterium]
MKNPSSSYLIILSLTGVLLFGCGKPKGEKGKDGAERQPSLNTAGLSVEQRDPKRLWCKEHNRYEDRCWKCRPEMQDKNRPYCEEHGLYEDECVICNPAMKPVSRTETKPQADDCCGPADEKKMMCREHNVPEKECGICHPDLIARMSPGQGLKLRLPSATSAELLGVTTAVPTISSMKGGMECNAEISFNQNKLAHIVAPAEGIIQSVDVDLGSKVKESQMIARLWSASFAEVLSKAVLTHKILERNRKLRASNILPEKDLQEAEAAFHAASQHARTLGFSKEDIETFAKRPDESVYLEIRAPFAGEIVERSAVLGSLVETGRRLFLIADRGTVWAMISIPESNLSHVKEGQDVELAVDALPGRTFKGGITWISAQVNDRTRMTQARAEVPNADGLLRDKMFARARILSHSTDKALIIPLPALQNIEGKQVVFIKISDDLFEARVIQAGGRQEGQLEVLSGLKADEPVVVNRSFALKSQLLISRRGAGCVD